MDTTVNVPLKKIRRKQPIHSNTNLNGDEVTTISGKLANENKQEKDAISTKHIRKKKSPERKALQNKIEGRKLKPKDKLKTESQTQLQSDFYPDPTLIGHMKDLHEDIIHYDEPFQSPVTPANQNAVNSPNKLYLQCTYGFKEIKSLAEKPKNSLDSIMDENKMDSDSYSHLFPVFVALHSQSVFLVLSIICQGLLAGLMFWHCLMIYFLRQSSLSVDDFYQHYSFMAYPFQSIIYFLHAISLLSVLDKCDLGYSMRNFCHSFIVFNPIVYLVVLYTVAFILSLAIKQTEDKIVLEVSYKNNTNPSESFFKIKEDDYYEWWIMNIVRTVVIMFNWVLICILPNKCQLTSHMKEIL